MRGKVSSYGNNHGNRSIYLAEKTSVCNLFAPTKKWEIPQKASFETFLEMLYKFYICTRKYPY